MEPLRQIREILKAWRERVEVLPAAGGALEDLLHPDAEEQEERAFTDERIFDTIWERAEGGERVSPYRPTPPIARTQTHLFRYFLDGSLRSYSLGTALEGDRNTPVHYAQIGACVLGQRRCRPTSEHIRTSPYCGEAADAGNVDRQNARGGDLLR
jgi:hypothetical protein